jgi:hypothetical protein
MVGPETVHWMSVYTVFVTVWVATVLMEVTVVVVVTVLVACPTAKNRLAEISTPAMTIAEAIAR